MAKDGNVIKMGKIAAYKDPIILREYERLRRLAFPAWFKEHRKHWKRIPLTAHVIAYRKQWAKNNPEKRKKYWQKDNAKPERKNYQRKWHHANRTRRRIRARELRLANPAAAKAKCARRRARRHAATLPGDQTEITQIYQRAEIWRGWGFDVEVDHIYPCGFGWHEPSNLQVIYKLDNRRKQANPDYKPSKIFT
jgi:hypothetical protein